MVKCLSIQTHFLLFVPINPTYIGQFLHKITYCVKEYFCHNSEILMFLALGIYLFKIQVTSDKYECYNYHLLIDNLSYLLNKPNASSFSSSSHQHLIHIGQNKILISRKNTRILCNLSLHFTLGFCPCFSNCWFHENHYLQRNEF